MPAQTRKLIKASVFRSVFKLYVVLVWGVLLYPSMSSGFNLPNQHDCLTDIQRLTKKKKQNPQETESEEEPPRFSPSEQEGLKHILVAVDVVLVLLRYAPKQRCFESRCSSSTYKICTETALFPKKIQLGASTT